MSAAITAAVIGGAATIYSASQQADAAQSAGDTEAASNERAIAEHRRQFDTTQSNFAPWLDSAKTWLPRYSSEVGAFLDNGVQGVMNQPGYQFGLSEGLEAQKRKIAASGGRTSGAAIKAATRYATDYATAGYDKAYQQSLQRLDRIAQMAGYAPVNAAANYGQQSANAISGLISQGGENAASAQLARGNIYGGMTNQLGAQVSRAVGGLGNSGGSSTTAPASNPWLNTDVYS